MLYSVVGAAYSSVEHIVIVLEILLVLLFLNHKYFIQMVNKDFILILPVGLVWVVQIKPAVICLKLDL